MLLQIQTMQLLGYIFEAITVLAGILTGILILRKNSKYLGNRFMAAATISIGLYVLFILIYDIIGEVWATQTFLPIAMCFILLGTTLIFFSMLCFVQSDQWFRNWLRWTPFLLVDIAYGVYILMDKTFITPIDSESVNTKIDMVPLAILVVLLLFYLGASEYIIVRFGIKRSEGESRIRMKRFSGGVIVGIIAIIVNVVSQIFAEGPFGEALDLAFFGVLAVCVVTLSSAFVQQKFE